jgi:hypothetical protein
MTSDKFARLPIPLIRLNTRDKEQLSPDNANENFCHEPNITGEGHSSLAKFKESLKSSSRTNHTAGVAQVDLEKRYC